jgi:PhnB protein
MISDPDEREVRSPAALHLYVGDVDSVFAAALAAGGTAEGEVTTHFYGDRSGGIVDNWGNRWTISTHVEDVPEEEVQKRLEAMATA